MHLCWTENSKPNNQWEWKSAWIPNEEPAQKRREKKQRSNNALKSFSQINKTTKREREKRKAIQATKLMNNDCFESWEHFHATAVNFIWLSNNQIWLIINGTFNQIISLRKPQSVFRYTHTHTHTIPYGTHRQTLKNHHIFVWSHERRESGTGRVWEIKRSWCCVSSSACVCVCVCVWGCLANFIENIGAFHLCDLLRTTFHCLHTLILKKDAWASGGYMQTHTHTRYGKCLKHHLVTLSNQ